MIDLKKPRLIPRDAHYCDGCTYMKDDPEECDFCGDEIVKFDRLQELENAIESGELVPVVRCKDCANACAEGEQYWCNTRGNLHDGTEYCSQGYVKMDLEGEK